MPVERTLAAALIAGFLANPGLAAEGPAMAVGAKTCGSSTCHAAERPWPNSAVTQKEYLVWKQRDPHARSYQTLTSKAGQRISRRLGLGDASRASLCLSCHTHNPPPHLTEPSFDHKAGVSCEACHANSSTWLGVHQSGLYFYPRNIEEGMYPTTDARKRAELCLSCHVGTPKKFVSHEMMAAGHPRMPFELGFYTWFSEARPGRLANYAHFDVDDDYLQRKPWPFGVRVWAIGQAVQAKVLLDLLTDPRVGNKGLFPELAFFRCNSCHRAEITGPGLDGTYGLPRLNDANLHFVEVAASLVDRGLARRINSDVRALRAAEGQTWPDVLRRVRQLKRRLDELLPLLETHGFTARDTRAALSQIARGARRGVYSGYIASEQAVLAAGSLVDELEKLEELTPDQASAAQAAIRRGLAAFVTADRYRPGQVQAAIRDAARIAGR